MNGPEINATARSLLGLLTEGPMTGWELVGAAWERVGSFWTIQRSQAYRELGQLNHGGLVEALPEGERRRRPYRITDAGRAAFQEWVQGTPGDENVRIPFLLTVTFADDIDPERFSRILEGQKRRHRDQLETYQQQWPSLEGEYRGSSRLATLALGIAYERAALDWLEKLPSYLPGTDDRSPQEGPAVSE